MTSAHKHTHIVKGKVHPRTGNEGLEGEKMYSSTLSLTSALDGVGGQCHFTPEKTQNSLYRRLDWPQGWYGRAQ
jgi:hypothetical protein